MTRTVVTVQPFENLLDVANDMARFHVRHIPVVDDDKLVGLLSQRDLLKLSTTELYPTVVGSMRDAQAKQQTLVSEVMIREIETLRPNDTVEQAARKLTMGRFGCLPVAADDDELVGIVTTVDLLRLMAERPPAKARQAKEPVAC